MVKIRQKKNQRIKIKTGQELGDVKKIEKEIDTLQKEIQKIIAEEQIQRMENKIEEIKKYRGVCYNNIWKIRKELNMRKRSEEGQQTMKDPNTSEMVYDPDKIKNFIEDYFKDMLTTN